VNRVHLPGLVDESRLARSREARVEPEAVQVAVEPDSADGEEEREGAAERADDEQPPTAGDRRFVGSAKRAPGEVSYLYAATVKRRLWRR
jgi:hypothetical protein